MPLPGSLLPSVLLTDVVSQADGTRRGCSAIKAAASLVLSASKAAGPRLKPRAPALPSVRIQLLSGRLQMGGASGAACKPPPPPLVPITIRHRRASHARLSGLAV